MVTDSASPTHISEIGAVFVPVSDQDRALAFYLDTLGFEKRGNRFLMVEPG